MLTHPKDYRKKKSPRAREETTRNEKSERTRAPTKLSARTRISCISLGARARLFSFVGVPARARM